jgi:protocatechuate 4,5-dioxygenase alpha subunit
MDQSTGGARTPRWSTPACIKSIRDIPGTTVFDSINCRKGYHLNMCCMSLNRPENRAAFDRDEAVYLDRFPLSEEQRQALLARDYNRMLQLGGNIYYIGKLGLGDGLSFQKLASLMTGIPEAELRAIMIAGGRAVDAPLVAEQGKNDG